MTAIILTHYHPDHACDQALKQIIDNNSATVLLANTEVKNKLADKNITAERFESGTRAVGIKAGETQAIGSRKTGAQSIGALAIGALAFSALAIGALAIGHLTVRRMRIGKLQVGEMEVDVLRVRKLEVQEKYDQKTIP